MAAKLRPKARLTVSQWADQFRYLDSVYSAEPGRWSTDRVPFAREIMDAFSDPDVGRITLKKSARVAGTESMTNMLGYAIDQAPGNVLWVLPTEPDAREEWDRMKVAFENCSRVMEHASRGWANETDCLFAFASMRVWFGWATAPRTLIRKTCRYVFFDELDNIESNAGDKMGDVLSVAAERITTWGHRAKIVDWSTPLTDSGSCIKEWKLSDQRQYYVPCPLCGQYQTIYDDHRIKIPEDMRDPDQIELSGCAKLECEWCGELIDEGLQGWMVDRGVWVPRGQEPAETIDVDDLQQVRAAAAGDWRPDLSGDPPETRRVGFTINSMYSPWRTWSQIIAEFMRAKDDPDRLRVYTNSWLGQPWVEKERSIDVDLLRPKLVGAAPAGRVPARAIALVGGADVQLDYLVYIIRAWGPHEESWLIREGTCETFEDLVHIMFETGYPVIGDEAHRQHVRACGIDTNYRTEEVYDFAGENQGRIVPVRGVEEAIYRHRPTRLEYHSHAAAQSITLYLVNTGLFKDKAHRLARNPAGHKNEWHLHKETTEDYMRQFTAEQKIWERVKGKRGRKKLVWRPKVEGRPNHYLDCEVYGLAVADMISVPYLTEEDLPGRQSPEPEQQKEQKQWLRSRNWAEKIRSHT